MTADASDRRMTYAGAGVNIDTAADAKRRIRELARATFTPGVLTDIGSFGALFRIEPGRYPDPLLASSCDGVGTKLKIAFMTGIHDTVGYDLVSHCVSDILVQGARPLFFLDYVASGRIEPDVVAEIVKGLARGCSETGCALIAGETAEMPDFYTPGEYDLAGFIVGVVDRSRVIDGSRIKPGDVLLGLASAGLHTNGYSLARKLFFERLGLRPSDRVEELGGTVAEVLLAPHRSYYALIEPLLDTGLLKGLAHITGGGITDNLPRILPPGAAAVIKKSSWPILPIFRFIQREGNVNEREMYRTFNMGIGMIAVTGPRDEEAVVAHFEALGERCHRIGTVVEGRGTVEYAA